MYCPYCGVNNDRGEGNCFICGKPLPSLGAPATPAAAARAERRAAVAKQEQALAAVGDRMLALIFDRVLLAALLVAVGAGTVDSLGAIDPKSTTGLYGGIGVAVLIIFLYHVVFEGAFGTTLGKAMMGLQVRTLDDRNRFAAAALRNLLRIVDSIGLYLIGFFFATFTIRRQRVGDLVGHTVVMDAAYPRGARAAMMVLWVAVIAGAFWMASMLCPTCRPVVPPIG